MAHEEHTPEFVLLEEAITILFCELDDAYRRLNPNGRRYESLKKLSDSEVITLALFQQLRGIESERSFLREATRFFSHLFPGVVGLHPSSLHRRVRKLRRYLEPLRRAIVPELVGEPETLIVDSTLLEVLHPRQVGQSAGFDGAAWVRWGTFSVYGVKLHMMCATNRVPLSYELSAANVAEVNLTEELLAEAELGNGVARKLLGDLAYRSAELEEELAGLGIVLATSSGQKIDVPGRGSRSRSAFRASRESLAWARRWLLRSSGWRRGSWPRSVPTPTLFGSTDVWGDRKGGSKTCGHKPNNTHLVWSNFSYYADLFEVDGPLYRVTMLATMLFSIALAVNVHGALDGGSAGFAASYVALRVLLVGLYAWAWRHVEDTRALATWHIAGFSAGALIWAASLLVPEPARYWVWGLGLLVEMATPILAQFLVLDDAPVQRSHVPERFGLFTIVVLGESVLVTGVGVSDTEWAAGSVTVAVLGFVAVGCLWWLYFDHVIDEAAVEHAFTNGVREVLVGFSWAYGHLAVYIGLAATAVGIEFAIGGAIDPTLEGGARAALCGGVGLYLLAVSVLHPLSPQPFPTIALAARLAVAAFAGGALSPLVLMALLALALVMLTAFEIGWVGRPGGDARPPLLGRKRKG